MREVLLNTAVQSLLIAFCIHFSYGSWTEIQSSLIIIGSTCLFIWSVLYGINSINGSLNHHPIKKIENIKSNSCSSPIGEKAEYIPKIADIPNVNAQTLSSPRMIQSPSKSLTSKVLVKSSTSISSGSQPKSSITTSTNDDKIVKKRLDYLNWTEYFLSVAMLSSMRSKDPSTQVGACIVNCDKRIVGIGYNGFPTGCSDDKLPWNRSSQKGVNHTKYPYVCHAEMNAILNKNTASIQDCIMYVSLFPCNECAKMVIQCGIKHIIYICDKYSHTTQNIASKKLLTMAGVKYTQYIPSKQSILINFPKVQ